MENAELHDRTGNVADHAVECVDRQEVGQLLTAEVHGAVVD
jgi:hypothetical protein